MDTKFEQRICIKFCYKIGKSASETLDLLKLAFGNENVNKPTTFRWFSRFKNGTESVKDEKRVGHPILHKYPEKVLPLVNVSICKLRSVIRFFFTAKNETAVNIHRYLVSVYGEGCMSIQMVRRWRSWFLEGRKNVHDDERSGRPVTATDNAAVAAVRNVVEADRRVTIDEIMIRLPPGIEIGRSSIGTIMSDVLNFRKVCARWFPRLLLEKHKQQWMEAVRAFLEMHRRDGDQLFSRIVTGGESWVHYSTSETKRQSMVLKKPEESAPKKAKVTISAGQVMAIVF
ncbi:hypothetical protein LAZ67_7000296 [Cordylochernes scorpioides]|uniref:Mos1 transposase HTH domain-containing protein n=1 Tax=Cordylochernes scorpioides TaxID=51811 RepID=A0ABY6KLI1_9ARAC|nr:hypothetical protein LAZ67_7000296 [Cordylochernes scorpioides]